MGTEVVQPSRKSFRIAIWVLSFVMVVVATLLISNGANTNAFAIFVGVPILLAGVCAIRGSYFAVKGLKDQYSHKQLIGILVNFGFLAAFISFLAIAIYEM